MAVPIRDLVAGDGDEARLLRSGESLAITSLWLLAQRGIDAAFGEARRHVG
jgi:hypothetical protein